MDVLRRNRNSIRTAQRYYLYHRLLDLRFQLGVRNPEYGTLRKAEKGKECIAHAAVKTRLARACQWKGVTEILTFFFTASPLRLGEYQHFNSTRSLTSIQSSLIDILKLNFSEYRKQQSEDLTQNGRD